MNGNLLRRPAFWGPVALMLALACTPGISFIEDLGRHLLLGRIILETGTVPRTNLLTWTCPDFPAIDHHWLFQVLAALVHDHLGYHALIAAKMLAMAAALVLVLALALRRTQRERPAGALAVWIAGILAAVVLGYRAHIRPELISFLCLAGMLALAEPLRGVEAISGRRSWWRRGAHLAVMLFWVNSHIYFMFGLGVLAALALERWLISPSRRVALAEGGWWLAAVAVCCCNPQGVSGFLYPLRIMDNYGVAVMENLSPLALAKVGSCPMLLALPWLAALTGAALARLACHFAQSLSLPAQERPAAMAAGRPADVIIAGAALLAAAIMARHTALLALTAPLVVASALALPLPGLFRPRRWTVTALRWGTGLLLLLNIGLMWSVVEGSYARRFPAPLAPTPFGLDDPDRYRELGRLARSYGLAGPVYSDFNVGSLVEWNLYPQRGYADNRPEAFPALFWRDEVIPVLDDPRKWHELAGRRGFTMAVSSTWEGRFPLPFPPDEDPDWVLVHLDEFMAVWLKRTPDNGAAIRDLGWDQRRLDGLLRAVSEDLLALPEAPWWQRTARAESILFRLHCAALAGGADRALIYLEQLVRIYPDYRMARDVLRNVERAVAR